MMAILADVTLKEWSVSPVLSSVVGRHVYFCMARQECLSELDGFDGALKQVLQHSEYSDRAVRLKLREMEADGLITLGVRSADRRSRSLRPTDKLLEMYEVHADLFKDSLSKDFYLVDKSKT